MRAQAGRPRAGRAFARSANGGQIINYALSTRLGAGRVRRVSSKDGSATSAPRPAQGPCHATPPCSRAAVRPVGQQLRSVSLPVPPTTSDGHGAGVGRRRLLFRGLAPTSWSPPPRRPCSSEGYGEGGLSATLNLIPRPCTAAFSSLMDAACSSEVWRP